MFDGAVIAAMIAATLSFFGFVIVKEQEVSRFRQIWINKLREDVSKLIANLYNLHIVNIEQMNARRLSAQPEGEGSSEISAAVRLYHLRLNEMEARVRLRLNPNEPESRDVLRILVAMDNHIMQTPRGDFEILQSFGRELTNAVQVILRLEWRRVKRGELIYFAVKLFLFILSLPIMITAPWFLAAAIRKFAFS